MQFNYWCIGVVCSNRRFRLVELLKIQELKTYKQIAFRYLWKALLPSSIILAKLLRESSLDAIIIHMEFVVLQLKSGLLGIDNQPLLILQEVLDTILRFQF
jgi:hypothetical protein